jgi:hypothetical protein
MEGRMASGDVVREGIMGDPQESVEKLTLNFNEFYTLRIIRTKSILYPSANWTAELHNLRATWAA